MRWNRALARVGEIEAKLAAHGTTRPTPSSSPSLRIDTLAADLKEVWSVPTTDAKRKKRVVRTLVQEVMTDLDDEAGDIVLVIHWIGGVHTELRLLKHRRRQLKSNSADIIAAVRQIVLIVPDDLIAGVLNRNVLMTGHGNRWTRERVTALRSHHRIPVFKTRPDGQEPWLNLSKAARVLGIAPKTLRIAAETGEIEGIHPLPDGPWIFSRSALAEPAAQCVV